MSIFDPRADSNTDLVIFSRLISFLRQQEGFSFLRLSGRKTLFRQHHLGFDLRSLHFSSQPCRLPMVRHLLEFHFC